MRLQAEKQSATRPSPSVALAGPRRILPAKNHLPAPVLDQQSPDKNRTGHRSLEFASKEFDTASGQSASARFLHNFSQISIFSNNDTRIQSKLSVSEPSDALEQDADRVAEQVMLMPEPQAPRMMLSVTQTGQSSADNRSLQEFIPKIVYDVRGRDGRSLDTQTRAFFEPRLGVDLTQVRVHEDPEAARSAKAIAARAYTLGNHIVFGAGQHAPGTTEGRRLLAHELTHVVQQSSLFGSIGQCGHDGPILQRSVEAREPGPGEASAFERRDELAARLSNISTSIVYRFDGNNLLYHVTDNEGLTWFDQQLMGFIDRAQVVPLRLITSKGLLPGGRPTVVDAFKSGYVDLDDLLAADDMAFQLSIIHVLTERFSVPRYAQRLGAFTGAEFPAAHSAGIDAEVALLRDLLGDPSIRFVTEEMKPTGTATHVHRSSKEGYRVFWVIPRTGGELSVGKSIVELTDGTILPLDEFVKQRQQANLPPL